MRRKGSVRPLPIADSASPPSTTQAARGSRGTRDRRALLITERYGLTRSDPLLHLGSEARNRVEVVPRGVPHHDRPDAELWIDAHHVEEPGASSEMLHERR